MPNFKRGVDTEQGFMKDGSVKMYTAKTLPDPALLGAGETVVVGKNLVTSFDGGFVGDNSPSDFYVSMLSCAQIAGSGIPRDQSKAGNDAIFTPKTTDAEAWGAPGYASVVAGTGKAFNLRDKTLTSFDLMRRSFIMAVTINLPATIPSVFNSFGNTYGAAADHGFSVQFLTSGKIRPIFVTSGSAVTSLRSSQLTYNTATDVNLVIAYDHISRTCGLYSNGILTDSWVVALSGVCDPTKYFGLGMAGDNGLGVVSTAAHKFKNFHLMAFNHGLPLNIGAIAKKINSRPSNCLMAEDIILPAKFVKFIVGPAQSNEKGSGELPNFTQSYGLPALDGLWGQWSGSSDSSMWPRLIERAAKKYTHLSVHNSAIGASSLPYSWVGSCKQWSSSMLVIRGMYVLSGGGLWKCNATDGTVPSSTVAPTGTADTTGADSVPWLYLGVPTVDDTDGKVYSRTSPRFDPNGYFAAALTGVTGYSYADNFAIISIGQTDATLATTKAVYKNALIESIEYWLANNVKPVVGFTCYAPSADAIYQSSFIPAYTEVLEMYSSNHSVKRGVSLREELGALPSVTVPYSPVPSVMNYGLSTARTYGSLHMNDAACVKAADAYYDLLSSSGII